MATTTPPPAVVFFIIVCSAVATAGAQRDAPPPPPVTEPYGRFNPSIAIIVVILLSAFFLMAFFALYIRRCADDDPSIARPGVARSRRSAAAHRGLDPAVVAAFPTLEYSVVKDLKLGKSVLECAVCLCEFDDDEALRLLPACSHVFHPDCIGEWLRSHTTCPVCRANLAAPGHPAAPPDPVPAAYSGSDSDSVAIDIDADPIPAAEEVAAPARPPAPQRAKSMRRARFPRSHSTGHSVVRPGEDCERYTLRLPEEVRKEVLRGKLNRTGSSVGRGRSFGRWERFARSDRWVPFFSHSFSARASSRSIRRGREEPGGGGGGDGGSVGRSGRMLLTSVKAPFECLTGARAGTDPAESSSRSAVPVFSVTSSG